MEEQIFKPGDAYRICDDCGEMVPANRYKCVNCGADISPTSRIFRVAEKKLHESGQETGALRLQCTSCGKRWSMGTCCPDCGGFLTNALPAEPESDYLPEAVNKQSEEPERIPAPQHEAVGESLFYGKAEIYDDYRKMWVSANSTIKFTQPETVLGRERFLCDPELFFLEMTDEQDERFQNISRRNVVLTSRADGLFVRYVDDKKSEVSVNGIPLQYGEERRLEADHTILFGADRHSWVKVTIGRQENELLRLVQRIDSRMGSVELRSREMLDVQQEILSGQKALLNSQEELKAAMAGVTEEDLRIRESETENDSVWEIYKSGNEWLVRKQEQPEQSYTDRLERQVPETLNEELMRQTIREFLVLEQNGKKVAIYDQVEEILCNRQLLNYLYQAAFFEGACKNMQKTSGMEDYSAPLGFIGRAMEEYICTEFLQLVLRTQEGNFLAYVKGLNNGEYKCNQGQLTRYMGDTKGEKQMEAEIRKARIRVMLEALGINEKKEQLVNEFKTAANQLVKMTLIRNEAMHANASGRMIPEKNRSYIRNISGQNDEVDIDEQDSQTDQKGNQKQKEKEKKQQEKERKPETTSRKDYEEKKQKILGRGVLELVHTYYLKACELSAGGKDTQ